MSALIICYKWCSGMPILGVSAWESNLITSLEALKVCDVTTFHFDEFNEYNNKKSVNKELINIIFNNSFDFIF